MALKVLYPSSGGDLDESGWSVDIVVVPSNGSPPHDRMIPAAKSEDILGSDSETLLWLQNVLASDLPHVRIMIFEHDMDLTIENRTNLDDVAKSLLTHLMDMRKSQIEQERPIICVAHFLGVLVVKQALLFFHANTTFQNIHDCMTKILFIKFPRYFLDLHWESRAKEVYPDIIDSSKMLMSHIETPIVSDLIDAGDTITRWTMEMKSNFIANERPEMSKSPGRCLHELQRPRDAVQLDNNAVNGRLELSDEKGPGTLESLECLANSYNMLRQFQKGVEMTEYALSLRAGTFDKARIEALTIMGYVAGWLGKNHPFTARATAVLAAAYNSSEHRDALELRQSLLELFERLSNLLPPESLRMIAQIGGMKMMADFAASSKGYDVYNYVIESRERTLLLSKRHLDPDYPEPMTVVSDLALIHESIDLYLRAAEPRGYLLQMRKGTTQTLFFKFVTKLFIKTGESDRARFVEGLEKALERDRQISLAYELSLSNMSRRRITPHQMRLLKAHLTEVPSVTSGNHQELVKFPGGSPHQGQMVGSGLERISINIAIQRAVDQTQGEPVEAGQFQLLDYRAREIAVSTRKQSEIEDLVDFNALGARSVYRNIITATSAYITQYGQAEGSMSHDRAKKDSDHDGRNRLTSFDDINEAEAKALAQNLTPAVSVSKYPADLQGLTGRQVSPRTLSDAVRLVDVDAVRCIIEANFDAVAKEKYEWIQELQILGYGSSDIAELLVDDFNNTPWIFFDPPQPQVISFLPFVHRPYCCHQGGEEATFAPRLVMMDYENTESVKRLIAEQCGVAGVLPKSRKLEEWTGHVTFAGDAHSTAWITYFVDDSRYYLIARIYEALQRFCGMASYLKKHRLCCTSFTVLHYAFRHELPAIELSRIDFDLAFNLLTQLQSLLHYWNSAGIIGRSLPELFKTADLIVNTICDTRTFNREGEASFEMCLDTVSLAVQILNLGLYSHSQSHTGAVHPFFLVNPLRRIGLFGAQPPPSGSETAHIYVSLSSLTCMAEATGDLVAVFGSRNCSEAEDTQKAYDLLASPEDLADTWAVRRFITHAGTFEEDTVHAIEIGDGLINCVDKHGHSTDSESPFSRLHWSRPTPSMDLKKPFHLRLKALIGTTIVNSHCPMDESQSWQHADEQMETLGTKESYWEVSERQVGIQGGQYAIATLNVTWVKQPGTTLKNLHLGANINLAFLQSDWGLQISYCTGAARRVSLCTLLADLTPIFMDARLEKFLGWDDLYLNHKMVDALREDNLRSWFDDLSLELQSEFMRIIRHVLLVLKDTGIDHSDEYLVVAWPQKDRPLGCFKIPCKKTSFWARMLADSGVCATFAYVTPLCLETDECKCQNLEKALWHNTSAAFNTAVSPFMNSARLSAVSTEPWALRHEQSYLIGKPGLFLLGEAVLSTTLITIHNRPRLYVSPSKIPGRIQQRLLERIRVERIREKQCTGTPAQQVMVLTKSK